MLLLFAGLTGLLAALFVHWGTWYMRLNYLSLAVVAGTLSALGLTGFFLLYLRSDIANLMMTVLVVFWAVALVIGYLQARSLPALWWKGILGVFTEMAVAFLIGATVNLTLQRNIRWLEEQFPGIDVYALINSFLWGLVITLLVLAVIRPLIRLTTSRAG